MKPPTYPGTRTGACKKCGSKVIIRDGADYEPGCLTCFIAKKEEERKKPIVPCYFCGTMFDCDCIERIECDKSGMAGHASCGICPQHGTPKFRCTVFHNEARVIRKVMLPEHPTPEEQERFEDLLALIGKNGRNA